MRSNQSKSVEPNLILGKSRKMRDIARLIQKIKDTNASALIAGESGTGKELVAGAIHFQGNRRAHPFVPVNCAAIPDSLLESELFGAEKGAATDVKERLGKFEEANGGTIFLDEVADLSPNAQAKILRVLQERALSRLGSNALVPLDIRVISATNKNLKSLLEKGEFREDLYFRLNVISLNIPPLRERREDIHLLMDYFVDHFSRILGKKTVSIPRETMESYLAYSWPGNVRELQNVVEGAMILLEGAQLPPLDREKQIKTTFSEVQRTAMEESTSEKSLLQDYAKNVMDSVGGNKQRACEILQIDFKTLQKRLSIEPRTQVDCPRILQGLCPYFSPIPPSTTASRQKPKLPPARKN